MNPRMAAGDRPRMSARLTGWLPALRIARRDALRHRGRSILVLAMVALPVLAVSAAAVVAKSAEVTGAEGADRRMGAAAARVWTEGPGRIVQAPDPDRQGYSTLALPGDGSATDILDEAAIRDVLGTDVRLLPIRGGWGGTRIGDRVVDFEVTEVDLGDALTAGLFDLGSGRLPRAVGEVVVNEALLAKGVEVGDDLELADRTARVVGSGRHAEHRDFPAVIGPAGSVLVEDARSARGDWLVDTGSVTWSEVQALNARGGIVASRAVLSDPPDVADTAERLGHDTGRNETFAIVALIIVMALLEVVLLAGPAFAVGARRQARSLALMAACGGTPAQSRRVVLAGGVVLGAVASAAGLVLGVLAGIALLPLAQRSQATWFGPLEVPVPWLAAIAVFGLASALLASVVPAWLASRQDVVAVLAGRRGERRPRASTPVIGLVLLGVGIAGSSYGALTSDSGDGALWIAASAVVSVLGMIMVVPVVVAVVGRGARRLPLAVRYAARDAARHRTRTVPAVAAVAATVAGVVALGIANASDERENEQTYSPQLAHGTGRVTWLQRALPGEVVPDTAPAWDRMASVVRDTAPDVDVTEVVGLPESSSDGGWTSWQFTQPGRRGEPLLDMWGGGFASSVLVGDDADGTGLVDESSIGRIDAALAAGDVVVFTSREIDAEEVVVVLESYDAQGDPVGAPTRRALPATYVVHDEGAAPAQAILPAEVAASFATTPATVGLLLVGDLDPDTETRIDEALGGAVADSSVYVERGYERPDEAIVILLVLFTLGGVLMLGGTLTATFLALSDARPDLATLSAVGAAPRTRRGVAAAYALVVGFVGALLGAAVGLIPGIAISRPLTSLSDSGPYLDIPWVMIGALVLVLPVLTAAVVGLSARSRLPLVARLD